ncbi:MAG: YkvA family protein [Gemmatimonadota bacterium]
MNESPRTPDPGPEEPPHRLSDVEAVIESARVRDGRELLERFLRKRLPDAEEEEIQETADVAEEIIDSIPVFLARAFQQARQKGMVSVAGPVLFRAQEYFLQPMDLIPEMTQGLAGLLDDAYLVLRTLSNLDRGPEPFLDWDLEHPLRFLRALMGDRTSDALDALAVQAMQDVSAHLSEVWARMSHPA